jgi:hypothetical protein
MSEITYKHTARVKADSWFIKFYLWLWEADLETVDFCKLFWGYLFAVPNLLVQVIGYLPYKLGIAIADSTRDRRESWKLTPADEAAIRARSRARRVERKQKFDSFFGRVSATADRVVAAAKAAWPVAKYPVYAVASIAAAVLVCLFGVGVYLLAALVIANLNSVAHVLLFLLITLAAGALLIGIGCGTAWFIMDTRYGKQLRTGTKSGFLTFGGVMRTGFFGIKSRTCPKVEIVGSDEVVA